MLMLHENDNRVTYLCAADKILGKLILTIGTISWPLQDDFFVSLVKSIISQQLSNKAAASIYRKFETLCGVVNPERVAVLSEENLRQAGLSQSKIRYISGLAQSILTGELSFQNLDSQNNADVIKHLTQIKGIGQWTAEMFLIFSLHREDVLSFGDAGLQSTIRWLYGTDERETKAQMNLLQQVWSPYNSVAALYLWEAVDRGLTRKRPDFC